MVRQLIATRVRRGGAGRFPHTAFNLPSSVQEHLRKILVVAVTGTRYSTGTIYQTKNQLMRKILFLLFIPAYCAAQNSDSATSLASPAFKINASRTFWMGKNYRTEWRTPIRVPVINFATEKGGLTPIKRGGGKQTKSRVNTPRPPRPARWCDKNR